MYGHFLGKTLNESILIEVRLQMLHDNFIHANITLFDNMIVSFNGFHV